jgi:hypothetical protein
VDNRAQALAGNAVKMVGEKLITLFVVSSHARLPLAKSVSTKVDSYQSGGWKSGIARAGRHEMR